MVKQIFLLSLISMTSLLSASSSNESKRDTTLSILRSTNYAEIDLLLQQELKGKRKKTKRDTLLHLAIELGNLTLIKHLIQKTNEPGRDYKFLLKKGRFGNNLLARACIHGHKDIVHYFLENCPFRNDSLIKRQFLYNRQSGEPNKHSAENIAREHKFNHIAQLIANHTKKIKRNSRKPIGHISKSAKDSPLHIAIEAGDLDSLKKYITKKHNETNTYKALLAKGKYGYNALGRAAFHGGITIVQYLLTQCPFGKGTKARAQFFNNHTSGIANKHSAATIAQTQGYPNIAQLIKSYNSQPTTSSSSSTTTTQTFMGTQSPTKVGNLTRRRGRGRPRKQLIPASNSSNQKKQTPITNNIDNEQRGKKREREESTTIISTTPQSKNKRQQTVHNKNIEQTIAFENVSQLPCFSAAIVDDTSRSTPTDMKDDAKNDSYDNFDLDGFESFLSDPKKESFSVEGLGDY